MKGTIHGVGGMGVTVSLNPSLGVSGPSQSSQVDGNGAYSFSGLASGIYAVTATAPGARPAGPFLVQVSGKSDDVKTVDITMTVERPLAFDQVPQVPNTPAQVWFSPVGHTLQGPFLKFWQANGGLAIFGYPISEQFPEVSETDGKTYTVQYFERNRFEYHPEFAGTPNEVLMGLLGVQVTRGRVFAPGTPSPNSPTQVFFPRDPALTGRAVLELLAGKRGPRDLRLPDLRGFHGERSRGRSTSSATGSSITPSLPARLTRCCLVCLGAKWLAATAGLHHKLFLPAGLFDREAVRPTQPHGKLKVK